MVLESCRQSGRRPVFREPFLIVGDAHALSQGWKLHVSAGVLSAEDVACRCLPTILDAGLTFKIVSSLSHLAALNDGRGGQTQIGKFITLYPDDADAAVRVAATLDSLTRGLHGPCIRSDRRLRPDSIIYYRFGGFGDVVMRTSLGDVVPAIVSPSATSMPDQRNTFHLPSWLQDPFVAAGLASEIPQRRRLVNERFLLLANLHRSPRSAVQLALDTASAKKCVVKIVSAAGGFEIDRLHREHAALQSLTSDHRFPTPLAMFEESGEWFLVMEDLDGSTMERLLISLRGQNVHPPRATAVRWGCELADILQTVHDHGYLHGDVKASNVIVAPDGVLRLVDFDAACYSDVPEPPKGPWPGTVGYLSPQRQAGHPPTAADDVYALGALLYLIVTGAEPSCAPDPRDVTTRPIEVLNPAVDVALAEVVRRCLAPDPERRFRSPAECARALRDQTFWPAPDSQRTDQLGEHGLKLARDIGDMLNAAILPEGETEAFTWRESDFAGPSRWRADLNVGGAGALLALVDLACEFDAPHFDHAMEKCAWWLREAAPSAKPFHPGLYVGEAGVASALLRAGCHLGATDIVDAATDLAERVADQPYGSPDLFNGTAGRLRAHLWFFDATSDQRHLDHAKAAATELLGSVTRTGEFVFWPMPPGYGQLSGQRLTGYAHGAAGIADALLDLYEVTNDRHLADAAVGVAHWLAHLRTPALDTGEGLNWPGHDGVEPTMAFWCHGAAGIARFLLRLDTILSVPWALAMARRAADTVAQGTRWSGSSQCHGLSGNIECLLDFYAATHDREYLRQAEAMASLLPAFLVDADGRPAFITENGGSGPGFTHGCSGVVSCLLRLAHPLDRPHLLSSEGFRRPAWFRPAQP